MTLILSIPSFRKSGGGSRSLTHTTLFLLPSQENSSVSFHYFSGTCYFAVRNVFLELKVPLCRFFIYISHSIGRFFLDHFQNCSFCPLQCKGLKLQQETYLNTLYKLLSTFKPAPGKLKAFFSRTTNVLCTFAVHEKMYARNHSSYQNMANT